MRKRLVMMVLVLTLPAAAGYDRQSSAAAGAAGEQLAETISSIDILAPLAPVALSPFFGITCLSATAILSGRGILPENDFLTENPALDNGLVFIVFLALSILTSLPKMTTVSKGFAEMTDQLETYAAIITYLVIFYLAGAGQGSASEQTAYTAGIFTLTRNALLMIAVVINVIVINTVKYFFELLVWITPFPGLDAAFESANKAATAGLAAIYAFSPWAAMVLNVILFLICLVFFNGVRRRVHYFKAMYIAPIVAALLGRTVALPSSLVHSRLSRIIDQAEPLMQVFPLRKIRKLKKKQKAYLTAGKEGLFLVTLRWVRRPTIERLDTTGAHIEITCGLLSNTVNIISEGSTTPVKLAFSKIYNPAIEAIAASLTRFAAVRTIADTGSAHAARPHPGPA